MGPDLSALDEMTDAVESGSGLPDVVRAASRALGASLVLSDRGGAVLAVAARSPADEQSLHTGVDGVERIDLRVADDTVGTLLVRPHSGQQPSAVVLRLVVTLIASEVERLRAPDRASAVALEAFVAAVIERRLTGHDEILARAEELNLALENGASVLVARAHPHVTSDDGWRNRMLSAAERGARAAAPGAAAVLSDRGGTAGEVVVIVPGGDDGEAQRTAESVLRELQAGLPGHTCSVGRSRAAVDVADLARAANEALLAANVTEGDEDGQHRVLAFDDTGAYRLLLSAMSDEPAELQRFYAETVEPLVAYDEQYDTDLVTTVEAFLDCDGNVAGTAQRLFTHRHTIRYRLERVRDLSGLDVGSTDGREKLSLGLKAMRVLGIAHRGGPASEAGTSGGRVRRRS